MKMSILNKVLVLLSVCLIGVIIGMEIVINFEEKTVSIDSADIIRIADSIAEHGVPNGSIVKIDMKTNKTEIIIKVRKDKEK